MTSGLQQRDNALFQVISQLIDAVRQFVIQTDATIGGGGGGGGGSLLNATYLTATDETGTLPNSRELLAGANVGFDDTVSGERTVNGNNWDVLSDGDPNAGTEPVFDVLSNGDPDFPELIFAAGEVIMIETRQSAPGIIYAGGEVVMTSTPV